MILKVLKKGGIYLKNIKIKVQKDKKLKKDQRTKILQKIFFLKGLHV